MALIVDITEAQLQINFGGLVQMVNQEVEFPKTPVEEQHIVRQRATKFGRASEVIVLLAATAFLLSISRILEIVPNVDWIRPICLAVVVLSVLSGILICLVCGEFIAATFTVLLVAIIPAGAMVFSKISSSPFVFASGGDYYSLGLFGVIYIALRRGNQQWLLRSLYWLSISYACAYIVLNIGLSTGILNMPASGNGILPEDVANGRGLRVILASSFIVYGTFTSIASVIRDLKFSSIFTVLLFVCCLLLAQSRAILAVCFVILLIYTVTSLSKVIRYLALVLYAGSLTASMYVAFVPGENPFSSDKSNLSEWARSQSIEIAKNLIKEHLWTGIGIPNGPLGYEPITSVNYFFPADIGLVGVLVTFGVFGILLYTAEAIAACLMPTRLQGWVERKYTIGLGLSGAVMTIYSALAPVFAGGSGTFWGVFFLALFFVPKYRVYVATNRQTVSV